MDSRSVVGDNVVMKSSACWWQSLARILLPGGLFIIALLRALTLSDGAVANDRSVLSEAGQTCAARCDDLPLTGER